MAGIAGLVSAGVGIMGALGGSDTASGVQMPQQWQMPNMTGAANLAYGGIQNLPGQSAPGQFAPQFQDIAQSLVNNPYAQMFQQGANQVAPYGQAAGMSAYGAGQNFLGQGQAMAPYAQNIMQTAFDPQNALRARTEQTLVDQTRAGQAARGVAMTPYGAAGESDALRKFDIDWQNAQLGRQALGGQAAGDLLTNSLKTSAGGAALSDTGTSQYLGASSIPYSTFNQIGQGQLGALSGGQQGVAGSQSLALNPVQAYLQYLGVGNQAGSVANQNAQVGLNQANMAFNQNQTLGSNLGAGIAGLGNSYKAGFPGAQSGWNWLSSFG
jgi:hypothetical protein